ncbi:hypothetical protein U1Q18_006553 [Sarracenia purpurea var. burkii]
MRSTIAAASAKPIHPKGWGYAEIPILCLSLSDVVKHQRTPHFAQSGMPRLYGLLRDRLKLDVVIAYDQVLG